MNSQQPIYDGTITQSALDDPNNTHGILLNLVGNNRDVLEIGCATGYMTRVMVERQNCRVVGFEINEEAGTLARPYLQRLITGNLENQTDLAKIEETFDVILIADVLEHLVRPEALLNNLRKHLSPGKGWIVCSVPNVAHWSIRRALLLGRWDLTEKGIMDRSHLRWFTRRTTTDLLESSGYKIHTYKCSYVFPGHWRFGVGAKLAVWAQSRTMPGWFNDLFAIQHIFMAL